MVQMRNLRARQGNAGSGSLSVAVNGIALSAGTMVRLGIGFLTWLVAARLYSTTQVGLAAAAISAMFLCVQVGMLGVDLALIALFPRQRPRPDLLLDTAIMLGSLLALFAGLIFVGLSAAGFHSLHVIAADPLYASLFLVLTLLGSVWWILDQASVALRRSDKVLVRAIIAAVTCLTGVATFGALGWDTAAAILSSWVAASFVACTIGLVQLTRSVGNYRFRPRLAAPLVRRLLSVGLPNFALSVADNAPGLVLPIIAAEVLAPRAAAFWYVVWMMSAAAYTIAGAFGLNLFAAAVGAPSELARLVRDALRVGVALAAAATVALEVLGPFVLSILGHAYALNGSIPLRILALGAAPSVVGQVYLAVCRATGRMLEGTIVAAVTGVLVMVLGAAAASSFGLTGIAVLYLSVIMVAAVVTGARLRVLVRENRPEVENRARWSQAEQMTAP
jgi:O-antigen/teichoic acid export membrane protein